MATNGGRIFVTGKNLTDFYKSMAPILDPPTTASSYRHSGAERKLYVNL
uniref:Uncharacterized protein n=1 Tax=Kalanchoe fedtschenkoi TaxID=63787 RepID=A0A7N0TUP3_KALFE